MSDKFDEFTKDMAQSVTRRGALKKCGLSLAGLALVALGFEKKAQAHDRRIHHCHCKKPNFGCAPYDGDCYGLCSTVCLGI